MPSLKFRQAIHAFTEVSAGKPGCFIRKEAGTPFAPEIISKTFHLYNFLPIIVIGM
jgi:hypothetical protein